VTVSELIQKLKEMPGELPVIHSARAMQEVFCVKYIETNRRYEGCDGERKKAFAVELI